MKTTTFLLGILITVTTFAIGVFFLMNVFGDKTSETFIEAFPVATTPISDIPSDDTPGILTISTASGTTFAAAPIVGNPNVEKLTDSFYVLTDDPSLYDISYYADTGIMMILLYKEPLSFSRAFAERKLLEVLPYTKEEICMMRIKVMTNAYVNPIYDGLNLGLSFCPNNVPLE